jgi:hypothetical protein
MDPIDNTNLIPLIGNNPINMQRIRVDGPSIIPAIDPPVLRSMELPVVRGLEAPIIDVPRPRIPYPVINVPTQQEFDAAVKAEKDKQAQEDAAKNRSLPDTTPPPQLPQVAQTPSTQAPIAEIPADKPQPTFTVYGVNINLPDPSVVATAGAVAVVTTATTMVANVAFNALKNAAEPMLREAAKNKFKIKLKQVKPVLHFVMSEGGNVDIFEYSSEGTKLVGQVDNVEQYLRDQVDSNSLYEVENKVIIDDVISDNFTKEGQKRFKPLFAPAKKIAKKLSSKFSI